MDAIVSRASVTLSTCVRYERAAVDHAWGARESDRL